VFALPSVISILLTALCYQKELQKALPAYLLLKRRNRRRCHRWWVHPINETLEIFGEFHKLCEDLNFFFCHKGQALIEPETFQLHLENRISNIGI
jgi:hypothetical protein